MSLALAPRPGPAFAAAIPAPEPGLTPEEVVARAVALRPRLRAEQAENDERGGYSEDLFRAFVEAGFYRLTTPRLFGGYEFGLRTFYKAMVEVSRVPGPDMAGVTRQPCRKPAARLADHLPRRRWRQTPGAGCGWSRKKRTISRDASGPCGSV
jgi:3-hydroxy-9,10-secoandrosta-1,3,5(10)-triene-9,17-dione monooxygenase